ncbi:MAG: M15 family metallopeptidase [Bacteroidota bacterium]
MNIRTYFSKLITFSFLFVIFSCSTNHEINSKNENLSSTSVEKEEFNEESSFIQENKEIKQNKKNQKDTITKAKQTDFKQLVDIQTLNSSILIDLKYASEDNFMKQRLYFDIDKVFLQKDVAERLAKVQEYLKELRPDLTLLVYDGVRPLSVQKAMWKALDTIPVKDRVKFVSNPASGSIHNYGAAVDLTIAQNNGKALDMGAGYDDIREIAYPRMENYFLQKGELTNQQIENRKLLRKVMKSQNFTNIPTEWWHFNACSRNEAKIKYKILQ